ncbi:MAG: division/cell wall cluster transcriptional repressor MraZ [Acidimicrobiales bacterium]
MTRFTGRFEHTLDSKGRLVLPAKYRPAFAAGGMLTSYYSACVALWPPEAYERQTAVLEAKRHEDRKEEDVFRIWNASTLEVQPDSQGRVQLPPWLRKEPRIEPDAQVLVTGAYDRLEIWNPEVWEERMGPALQMLRGDA